MNEGRLVAILTATYPDGNIGQVLRYVKVAEGDALFDGPHATALMDELYDVLVAAYHTEIGQAYSLDDFVFTVWIFDDLSDLYFTAGERLLMDGLPSTIKPFASGPSY